MTSRTKKQVHAHTHTRTHRHRHKHKVQLKESHTATAAHLRADEIDSLQELPRLTVRGDHSIQRPHILASVRLRGGRVVVVPVEHSARGAGARLPPNGTGKHGGTHTRLVEPGDRQHTTHTHTHTEHGRNKQTGGEGNGAGGTATWLSAGSAKQTVNGPRREPEGAPCLRDSEWPAGRHGHFTPTS